MNYIGICILCKLWLLNFGDVALINTYILNCGGDIVDDVHGHKRG